MSEVQSCSITAREHKISASSVRHGHNRKPTVFCSTHDVCLSHVDTWRLWTYWTQRRLRHFQRPTVSMTNFTSFARMFHCLTTSTPAKRPRQSASLEDFLLMQL